VDDSKRFRGVGTDDVMQITSSLAKIIVCSSTLLLLLTLTGCWHEPHGNPDPDYLTLIETDPCWQGICPGQTTREEVNQILPTIDFGQPGEIYELESSNSIRLWFDRGRFRGSSVDVYIKRPVNLVDIVAIDGFRNRLTLGQIVDSLGEPDWVMAVAGCTDIDLAGFDLWYAEMGIHVTTTWFQVDLHPQAEEMILDDRLAVVNVNYYGMDFDVSPLYDRRGSEGFRNHQYPWPGFDNTLPSFLNTCI
jgi:hypothetical protein